MENSNLKKALDELDKTLSSAKPFVSTYENAYVPKKWLRITANGCPNYIIPERIIEDNGNYTIYDRNKIYRATEIEDIIAVRNFIISQH